MDNLIRVREMLQQTYPRIRMAGKGWVLETAANVLVPVPDPDDKLAYVAHRGSWTSKQLYEIEIALQKLVPVPPDPSTLFYLEQLLEAH